MRYTVSIMHISPFLLHHLMLASGSWWLFVPIIIVSTIVLEDVTIALVGVLSADHILSIPFSLTALIAGIVIGDSIAYAIGRLAIRHKFARRIVEHERVVPLRELLREHSDITIFTTRFMPGFRFALYTTCGSFMVPYKRFLPISTASAIVWATSLFMLSFLFGFYTLNILGHWRWPILAVILFTFLWFAHRHWQKMTSPIKK